MRKLITSDVFALARIIKASGMRDALTAYVKRLAAQDQALDVETVGYEGMLIMIEALAERKAENALYEALAPVMELTPEEVRSLPPADFVANIKQIAEENDIKSFFGYVSSILGKK